MGQAKKRAQEIKELKKNTNNRRKTIFTVNKKSSETIVEDLRTLAGYGRKAFIGLGAFDGPTEMAIIAKKNGFIIDNGAIVNVDTLYEEMKNNQDGESSFGAMELQEKIYQRIVQDWGIWLQRAIEEYPNENIADHFMDLYFASTCMDIAHRLEKEEKQAA